MPDDSHTNGSVVPAATNSTNKAATEDHCHYCFDVLITELLRSSSHSRGSSGSGNGFLSSLLPSSGSATAGSGGFKDISEPRPAFEAKGSYPLFVTWSIFPTAPASRSSTSSSRLRGCIGTFEAQPIESGLAEYAITSALHDHRFSPITLKEVPRLECGISLLTDFEECSDYLDWEIGVHGIYIHIPASSSSSATSRSGRRTLTATYLPQIAAEQGWSKIEAIDSAIEKAGYRGRIDEKLRLSLRVQRYQSQKAEVAFEEYRRWKEARGERVGV